MRNFVSEDCFIISPIGSATSRGAAMREHVERVRTMIIDAALDIVNQRRGLKLRASRSDMRADHGSIKERFLQSIISDQILFVVLTYEVRPNVYYELGIAHSAARPIIVLSDQRLKQREFDIYDIKAIPYSFGELDKEGKAFPEVLPIEEVVKHLENILDREDDEHAFAKYDPLARQSLTFRVYDRFKDVTYADWGTLLNRADKSIDFYGTTLDDLARDYGQFPTLDGVTETESSLKDFLAAKVLFGKIDVTIALLHEDNPALEALLKSTHHGVDAKILGRVKDEIVRSREKWREVAENLEKLTEDYLAHFSVPQGLHLTTATQRGSFKLIQIRHGLGKFRMTLTDKETLVTPFFYEPPQNSLHPAFAARKGTSFYTSVRNEHEHLKAINEASTVIFVPVPGVKRSG